MIKISLKGLAKFMTSSPATQRKVLRDFKYPDPEGTAQAMYYREARDFISVFHRNRHGAVWLSEKADLLEALAASSEGQTATRLRHNARALRQYREHFGAKVYEVLGDVPLELIHAGVRISIRPDLHVRERGRAKILKLDFAVTEPNKDMMRIMAHATFKAASEERINLAASDVLAVDVPRGRTYPAGRARAKLTRDIEAACENIAAIWDTLR